MKGTEKKEKKAGKKSVIKTILKVVGIVLLAIILIAVGYFAYVFIQYHRIPDNQVLSVQNPKSERAEVEKEYRMVSFNIGFGAYEQDFGFFMDGGDRAWAWSKERLNKNLEKINAFIGKEEAEFFLIQEVDFDSTRTYHVDERPGLAAALSAKTYTFAQNWDSAFLFAPPTQPHGTARTGIMTFSDFHIESSLRRSLPLETGIMKIVDLDRCYSVNRIPTANGPELVVYNVHLSAYTSDGKIAEEQLRMMVADMQAEYEKGNFCVAGGDLNKDLSGNAVKYFGTSAGDYTWAQPIPESIFMGSNVKLVFPYDETKKTPSCRNADGPWTHDPLTQYVLTVDGFLVTDNVEILKADVIDTDFMFSDHNPVEIRFILHGAK
ncbi:MAG: endonuclease/exonuclease/phosphatase family protein [Lachnospiraceae bacterium]|nr:endonuclease/exonuclease/phosphatase family protein [Lachnospiraceae bacterium]